MTFTDVYIQTFLSLTDPTAFLKPDPTQHHIYNPLEFRNRKGFGIIQLNFQRIDQLKK